MNPDDAKAQLRRLTLATLHAACRAERAEWMVTEIASAGGPGAHALQLLEEIERSLRLLQEMRISWRALMLAEGIEVGRSRHDDVPTQLDLYPSRGPRGRPAAS